MHRAHNWVGVSLVALMLPSTAYAHPAGQSAAGFMSGLLHPVFGLDHFLAMLSVGIVSAQLGGRRILTVPAMFVASMIVGAVFGVKGYQWPLSEAGIALATVTETVGSWPVLPVVALFGSLHGHAHGLELPKSADPIYYAAGFLTSTVTIHILGVGIGHVFTSRTVSMVLLRHMGSAIAGMGLMFLKLAAG
jgi:urease accessory protein